MSELLIDYNIRTWVFLPIVLITLLVGIVHHYTSILAAADGRTNLLQVEVSQALRRSYLLRENGKWLPAHSFSRRKQFFNDAEIGYLVSKPNTYLPVPKSKRLLSELIRKNVTSVLPMMFIGGWINWMFSGFVTTRVPFPLTRDFKSMLQQGIHLKSLDASWVSSMSWYFLNVFGLRSMNNLFLREERPSDKTQQQNDYVVHSANKLPDDYRPALKAEWEALEIMEYYNALKYDEAILINKILGDDKNKLKSNEDGNSKPKTIKKNK